MRVLRSGRAALVAVLLAGTLSTAYSCRETEPTPKPTSSASTSPASPTSSPTSSPTPTSTSIHTGTNRPSPNPNDTVANGVVQLGGRESVRLRVGERLHIDGYDSDTADFLSAKSTGPTVLGPDASHGGSGSGTDSAGRWWLATAPGTATLTVRSYYHHCPDGPCAHPNPDRVVRITVTSP